MYNGTFSQGDRRQEAGDRRQETGDSRQEKQGNQRTRVSDVAWRLVRSLGLIPPPRTLSGQQ